MGYYRPKGGFPCDIENSKKVMEITLSSGRELIHRPLKKTQEVQVKFFPQQKKEKQMQNKEAKNLKKSEYPKARQLNVHQRDPHHCFLKSF